MSLISSNTAAAASTTTPPSDGTRDALQDLTNDFTTFLQLLTTQLKNQDPTSPMETNEFTNQIVAFTGVEQAVSTNENLKTLIGEMTSLNEAFGAGNEETSTTLSQLIDLTKLSNPAVFYIGKAVEAEGNYTELKDGKANLLFRTEEPAETVQIKVKNAEGKVVFSTTVHDVKSELNYEWDGSSDSGADQEDGIYTFEVTATKAGEDGADVAVSTKTYTTGVVQGAQFTGEDALLSIGDIYVSLSKISGVRNVAEPAI